MKDMGMYPGEPVIPETQWIVKTRSVTRPKNGGMFYPMVGPEYVNKTVPKGTLIAVIRDPLTMEVIEEMHAPFEETVFLDMRVMMTKVHPGTTPISWQIFRMHSASITSSLFTTWPGGQMYNDKVYHKKNFTDRTGIVPRDDAGLCHPQSRGAIRQR